MLVWAFVRYRFLTVYSRLPPEPPRQDPKMVDIIMEPDSDTERKSGISTYLDDFLSAIKVFGYLDRKVFHELTKHMRTHRFDAGETIKLKDLRGFSVVVEGNMEVFIKAGKESDSNELTEINGEKYQLLNEINKPSPLSSLFTILSLFTEDVLLNEHLRDEQGDIVLGEGLDAEEAPFNLNDDSRHDLLHYRQMHKDAGATDFDIINRDLIARASSSATVSVIPAEAFRNLTRKYPQSTSHIVQVILTRCHRVTLQTCHNYLNLTSEIFKSETVLNNKSVYELPKYLHDSAVRRLRAKRDEAAHLEQDMVRLKQKKAKKRKTKTSEALTPPPGTVASPARQVSKHVYLEPHETHPGDLLSSVSLSRRRYELPSQGEAKPNDTPTLNFAGDDETEDKSLRTALTECLFRILGFDASLLAGGSNGSRSGMESIEQSPRLSGIDDARLYRFRRTSLSRLIDSMNASDRDTHSDVMSSTGGDDDSTVSSTPVSYENFQQEAVDMLEIVYYKEGAYLTRQNDMSNGLFYVFDGTAEVGFTKQSADGKKSYKHLHDVNPGGVAGYLGTVLGYKSFVDIRAKTPVYAGFLSRVALERLSEKYPMLYISTAKTLTNVLSRLILHLDFALEWVQVKAGSVVFQQGDEADAIYFVLNGRLRSIIEDEQQKGKNRVLEEFGQGGSIGELEVLTMSKHPNTLHAIRDSELARFPRTLFESLALQHPSLTFEISKLVASRIRPRYLANDPDNELWAEYRSDSSPTYRTVAVVPVTSGLPVSDFADRLLTAFHDTNWRAALVNNATILTYLGRNAFNKLGHLKLAGYLADIEERFQTVIYVADTGVRSPWTRKCISQADCILLLADARAPTDFGEYETLLVKMKTTARTDLVLLHPERYVPPGSTSAWLNNRIWVKFHHHVQMEVDTQAAAGSGGGGRLQRLRTRMQTLQSELMTKYRNRRQVPYFYSASYYHHKNDFNRLARILSGRAVGLVLGGGGARGISHIGVIKALEENGIPIDFVGGTSIGSFVGGLYAKEHDLVPIYGRAKKFSGRIASLWRMALDLTYPATSYTTGHEFNRGIWKTFGENRIEDFWLKFYCNTTNITHSRMEVHNSGYAWRYIRASMSLAGLLPPLTDKGSMLLDGGYVDNLTVSEMKRTLGARVIFAVDVGSIDDTTPMSYGDTLSGIWVVFNRWNIFSRHPNVPNLAEIQQRLAYVSSVGALERAKSTPGVLYLRPPIDNYATLDFGKFDEILAVGTQYATELIERWKKTGKFPDIPGSGIAKGGDSGIRKSVTRRNSI